MEKKFRIQYLEIDLKTQNCTKYKIRASFNIFHSPTCQFFHARRMISLLFIGTAFFKARNSILSLNGYCLFKTAMSLVSDVVYDFYSQHILLLCNIHPL